MLRLQQMPEGALWVQVINFEFKYVEFGLFRCAEARSPDDVPSSFVTQSNAPQPECVCVSVCVCSVIF